MNSHELRICKIDSEGLRCPDYELVFENEKTNDVYPVSLVMMPNGTGKTTTLTCLRAIFSGEAEQWGESEVRSLKKTNSASNTGQFQVDLKYRTKRITVQLKLNFFDGTAEYWTNRGNGPQRGHELPRTLKGLMTKEFVRLFVFDGEESDKLLSSEHTKANQAVEALFKLNNFKNIESAADEFFEEETKNATAKTAKGIKTRTKTLNQYKKTLGKLEAKSAELEATIGKNKETIRIKNDLFGKKLEENEGLSKRHEQLQSDLKTASVNALKDREEVLKASHSPLALVAGLSKKVGDLRNCLDRAKLPENTSREFFEELAEEKFCVCGVPIDQERKSSIKKRSELYLGSDDVSVLNNIKSDINAALDNNDSCLTEEWLSLIEQMKSSYRTKNSIRNEVEDFRSKIKDNDPELFEAQRLIGNLESELKRDQHLLDELHQHKPFDKSTNADQVTSVHEAAQLVKYHEQRVQEQLGTVDKASRVELLKRILRRAHAMASQNLSSQLKDETNDIISSLMPNNRLRVESIQACIKLEGKRQGSVGETLCIGYAFLSSLFQRAENHSLPLVVDSPAGPLDIAARENLGEIVPKLSRQFIGLVISSEKAGFLPAVEREAGKEIQYLTLYRKSPDYRSSAVDTPVNAKQTPDGVVVEGREFFRKFQVDDKLSEKTQ